MLFLELLVLPIFHLFLNLYIGSKLINAFTTKFSQSPTKHSNLAINPSYLHNLHRIQSDTCTRSSSLVTLKRPTVCSRLKITERSFTHHAPVLWNALPKEFRQPSLHSPHAIQLGSILLRFSVYLQLNFIPSLKLIFSTNHSLLGLFHALTSLLWLFDLASGLSSHLRFSYYRPQPFIHLHYGLYSYVLMCLRISLHQITMVGFCRHFKSPH